MNQESREDFKSILIDRCKFLSVILATYLTDAIYLLGWLAIHMGLKWGVEWFHPIGYEKIAGYVLKIILEVPALTPVVVFAAFDTKRIIRRITQGANKDSERVFRNNGKNERGLEGDKP